MLKVGLTGGIGSGKSAVAAIFSTIGVPVYFADQQARALMSTDETLKGRINMLLGDKAFDIGGLPDSKYIATRVFQNVDLLNELNAIVHPAVRRDFERWSNAYVDRPYVIQEAAILFESGGAALMDEIIVVWAPEPLRLQRVMTRDKITENEVRLRMNQQLDDETKVEQAQFVIINDGEHSLITQVMDLDAALSHLSEVRLPRVES